MYTFLTTVVQQLFKIFSFKIFMSLSWLYEGTASGLLSILCAVIFKKIIMKWFLIITQLINAFLMSILIMMATHTGEGSTKNILLQFRTKKTCWWQNHLLLRHVQCLYLIVIILLSLLRILFFFFLAISKKFCMEGGRVKRRKQGQNEHLTTQKLGSKCLISFASQPSLVAYISVLMCYYLS